MIDFSNKALFKLKSDPSYAEMVDDLLIPGELVVDSYKSMRDGVVFTNHRFIAVNVQGITGKKRDFTSIPYSKVSAYSVESAGTFDIDADLDLYVSGVGQMRFEFRGSSKLMEIQKHISMGLFGGRGPST